MHRDGLFFDPLEAEEDAPVQAPEAVLPDAEPGRHRRPDPDPGRHRRPDPEDLKAQRQRELVRVQDELRRMATGSRHG